MAKKIRHGPRNGLGLAIAIALSILLFGCGGGANQPNIQQENTAPSITGGDLLSIYDIQNQWSSSEMRNHIVSDPDGLFTEASRRTASAVNGVYPYEPLTPERQDQVAKYVAFQLSSGMRREDIIIPAQLRPELTEEFLALTRDRLARRVSAVSVVEIEPSAVSPFGGRTVAYFAIPGDTLQRLHTLSVGPATTSTGKYWVMVANYSTGRWDPIYSGEGSATPNPVAMHSLERLDRYASDPVKGSDMYIAVIAEPTAVIQRIYAGLADRDDRTVRIGSRGYNFAVDTLTTEADVKGSSAVTSDLDGDEIDIIYTYDHVPDGLDTVDQTYMKDNGIEVGGVEALKESIVNNDDNTIVMDPPTAGSHTIKIYTISYTAVSADEVVGTVDLDLQPVTGLQGTFSGGDVVLTWTEPAQGVTNNIIYRSANGGAFSQIAEVGDVTTFTDTTPPSGNCSYKVVAKWVSGEQTKLSVDSSIVNVNTLDFTVSSGSAVGDSKVITHTCYRSNSDLVGVGRSGSDIVLYECIAGVWGSAQTVKAGFGGTPKVVVVGSNAYVVSANSTDGLVSFKFDLDGVNPVEEAVINSNENNDNPTVGAISVIGGNPIVAYPVGNTIRYASYSSGWGNDHQVVSLTDNATTIVIAELSGGKPALGIRADGVIFVSATTATPDDPTDWGSDTLVGAVPDVPFALVINDGKPIIGYQANGLRITKSAVPIPDDSTDWSSQLLAGGNVVGNVWLAVVPITGGDRLVAFYSLGSDVSDTAPDLRAMACADAYPSGSSSWAIRTVQANMASDPAWVAMPATMSGGGSLMVTTVGSVTPASTLYQFDW